MRVCLACARRFCGESWRCPGCGNEPARNGWLEFAPELAHDGDGFDESAFERLVAVEEASFWFRSRNRIVGDALARHFGSARTFLEVGCGTGFVLKGLRERFPELQLTGSELFVRGLEFTRERLDDVELLQVDARRVPFDAEFDVVGAFDVLEHVDEDAVAIQQLAQASRGGVIVTVPQHPWLWSRVDEFSHHYRRYTRRELCRKLERAGLEVLEATSFVTTLLPAMALSRLRQRQSSGAFDPMAEYRMSVTVDRALERLMRVEETLIRRGLSLPAGGSLLAVARKKA